jgi:glucokinase
VVQVRTLFPGRPLDAGTVLVVADVGGVWTRAAKVDGTGGVLERRRAETPQDPVEGIALVERLWKDLGPGDARAIAVAGGIRTQTGEVTQSPHLPRWEGTRPGERLGCPVVNDGNAAILGEAWRGALHGRKTALLVTVGRDIGGGLLVGGRLWVGAAGCAGEIGHVTVRPGGEPCACGNFGCLEAYANDTAIAKEAGHPDLERAVAAARSGDARAVGAFDQAAATLGIALAAAANLLNPEAICLGGAFASAFDLVEHRVRRELRSRAFRLAVEDLALVPARLGDDAGLLGAAWVALGRDERRPLRT